MAGTISRVGTGITGLDRLTRGGFPEDSTVTLIGSYGTGKTIAALHYINQGIKRDETCLYITLDQREPGLRFNAKQIGCPLPEDHANLTITHLSPVETNDLVDTAVEAITDISPDRVVIDTLSILLDEDTDHSMTDRKRMETLNKTVKQVNATGLFTAEAHEDHTSRSHNQIAEHVTDGVILLDYTAVSEKTFRTVEVRKMRNTNYRPGAHPMTIDGNGITINTDTTI